MPKNEIVFKKDGIVSLKRGSVMGPLLCDFSWEDTDYLIVPKEKEKPCIYLEVSLNQKTAILHSEEPFFSLVHGYFSSFLIDDLSVVIEDGVDLIMPKDRLFILERKES